MQGNHKGLVFNLQKYSIQDGPGIRTTVFMKGCPLTCPWCSNPEGLSNEQQIISNDRNCIGCGECIKVCPSIAISLADDIRVINWDLCNHCLKCAEVCPSKAIEVSGDFKTLEQVFKVVAQDAAFYRNSGGGVTLSGGEAMLQWEFALDLFKKCKGAGFHTVLDTSGHCKWEHMEQVLNYVDLVLFDIKHMDPEKHKEKTGVTNDIILENLEKAAEKTEVWVRIPLIPGFNDSEENMRRTAELAKRIKTEKVSLLPYHEYGKLKYPRLGKCYSFDEAEILPHDSETVSKSREIFESFGLNVTIAG